MRQTSYSLLSTRIGISENSNRAQTYQMFQSALLWFVAVTACFSVSEGQQHSITVDKVNACPFDRILLGYSTYHEAPQNTTYIGIFRKNDLKDQLILLVPTASPEVNSMSENRIENWWKENRTAKENSQPELLHCDITVDCYDNPVMISLVASPGYEPGSTITIVFNKDTNTPRVESKYDVDRLVNFSQSIGKNYQGEWKSKRILEILISDPTGHGLYHEGSMTASLLQGHSSRSTLKGEPTIVEFHGILPIRIQKPGWYQVRLLKARAEKGTLLYCSEGHLETLGSTDWVHIRSELTNLESEMLTTCGATGDGLRSWMKGLTMDQLVNRDQVVLSQQLENKASSTMLNHLDCVKGVITKELPGTQVPQSIWELSGVAALDAQGRGVELHLDSLHLANPTDGYLKTWSMTMWLYLPESVPHGNKYRSLLYHGKGKGAEAGSRTPSVWLLPDSNRLALRVSTDRQVDFGSDSIASVPTDEWVFLAFTFGFHGPKFVGNVYLNGVPVVTAKVNDASSMVFNSGNLYIGKDPWMPGTLGHATRVQLFNKELSSQELQRVMDSDALSDCQSMEPVNLSQSCERPGQAPSKVGFDAAKMHLQSPAGTSFLAEPDVAAAAWEAAKASIIEILNECSESPSGVLERGPEFQDAIDRLLVASRGGITEADLMLASLSLIGLPEFESTSRFGAAFESTRCAAAAKANLSSVSPYFHLQKASSAHSQALYWLAVLDSEWHLNELAEERRPQHVEANGQTARGLEETDEEYSLGDQEGNPSRFPDHPTGDENVIAGEEGSVKNSAHGHAATWDDHELETSEIEVAQSARKVPNGLTSSAQTPERNKGKLQPWETKRKHFLLEAARMGHLQGKLALGTQYANQFSSSGTPGDCETAAFYLRQVADKAFELFHSGGQEPILEQQLVSEFVPKTGELGSEDELIQFQQLQADQGNTDAMVAMGDLYYWGAHGLPRDQSIAFKYFEKAAKAGHPVGMSACGNLLLKGEGVPANTTQAREWYEKAAQLDNLSAMNGLGYLYFYGNAEGVEKNETKALEYFLRNGRDGDSLFNAAYMFHQGKGTTKSIQQARALYHQAADKFRHFDAAYALAVMYQDGIGSEEEPTEKQVFGSDDAPPQLREAPVAVQRSCAKALGYLHNAARRGRWGEVLRRGFDSFLANAMDISRTYYQEGAMLGYAAGAQNALWLSREQLRTAQHGLPYTNRLSLAQLRDLEFKVKVQSLRLLQVDPASPAANLYLGEYYYYGMGGEAVDLALALSYWSKASGAGSWSVDALARSQASYNVGFLLEHFAPPEEPRYSWSVAKLYYQRATSQIRQDVSQELSEKEPAVGTSAVVVDIALARLRLREFMHQKFDSTFEPLFQLLGTGVLQSGVHLDQGRVKEQEEELLPAKWVYWLLVGPVGKTSCENSYTPKDICVDEDWVLLLVLSLMLALVWYTRLSRARRVQSPVVTSE